MVIMDDIEAKVSQDLFVHLNCEYLCQQKCDFT